MNDIRRTILWVIFGFSMVLLWDKWQIHNGKKPTFFPTPQTASAPAADTAKPADTSLPQPSTTASAGDVPGAAAGQPAAAATPRQDVSVASDVMRLTFDSEGGTLKHSELLKYSDTVDDKNLMQVFEQNAKRVYLGQTGLIGGNFPTHKTPMTVVPGERELKDGQDSVQLRFESAEQGEIGRAHV